MAPSASSHLGPDFDNSAAIKLPVEIATGRGRRHGTSSAEPFDRWFRYPAGFASDYVTVLLHQLGLAPGDTVVDCFAGSGVTGTAARTLGLGFVGVEAHPMMAELANAKLARDADPEALRAAASNVVACAQRRLARKRDRGAAERARLSEPELVIRSFDPPVLDELLTLRAGVRLLDGSEHRYLKWALLATLREVASVKVGWPYQRPALRRTPRFASALPRFAQRCEWIADDLQSQPSTPLRARVVQGDATRRRPWSRIGAADGCVSSPPYLNNFDYADATRLEAYFWGDVTSWAQLCGNIRAEMLTATTQQSSVSARDQALRTMSASAIADELGVLTESLSAARRTRPRGKEYDQVLPAYFLAMSQVLSRLKQALSPGAPCVWLVGDSAPYGVYVDTPRLIGELAEAAGFQVCADTVLRQRGQRWSAPGRHGVELSERLLMFRRCSAVS